MSDPLQHPLVIRRVTVENIFGSHDIDITFNTDSPVTVIHGPNGVGKTVLLRMIHALSYVDIESLVSVPYKWMTITLSDGSVVTAKRELNQSDSISNLDPDQGTQNLRMSGKLRQLIKHFQSRINEIEEIVTPSRTPLWKYKPLIQLEWTRPEMTPLVGYEDPESARRRDREAVVARLIDDPPPTLTMIAENEWEDSNSGEIIPLAEVLRRHPDKGIYEYVERWKLRSSGSDWSSKLRDVLSTSFISVNRITASSPTGWRYRYLNDRDAASDRSALVRLARSLRLRIQENLAESVEDSRQLDSQFIDLALATANDLTSIGISEADVLEAANTLDDLKRRYSACGLIDFSPRRTVEARRNDAQLALLKVHFETEILRLQLLEDLQLRIELFQELVNSKFREKQLYVNREKGFAVTSRRGGDLPLNQLSSGEQHEVALIYRLLFQTKNGTFVMIDEPELSLHTVWQQQFIDDLLRIAMLTRCQYVIATHSPDLVGNHSDKMVGLTD